MSAAKSTPIEATEVPFARARAHAGRVEGKLSSTDMIRAPHSELEALCETEGREWARLMLEEHLAMRAALEKRVEVTGADGVARNSARDSERHLETLVGKVTVPRTAYQAPGSEDLHPMDASLNLPRELFSHGIRKLVAKEVARASFDEVVEMAQDWCGATIAKRQVEELAVRAAQDFDAFYEQREPAHDPGTDLLVLSTDGKGIVMRHEDLREATRRWPPDRDGRHRRRLPLLGERPHGPHRRPLVAHRGRGCPPAPRSAILRRLRRLLAIPPRPRQGAESCRPL